jgi:hypothetical protein
MKRHRVSSEPDYLVKGKKMATRKQNSAVDGQNEDQMGGKDELVPQTAQQVDSYHAKASEFPVKKVMAGHGQSSDEAGGGLVPWPGNLTSPRKAEIPSEGESDSMGSRASAVASNFKVSRNAGESGVAPVSPENEYSVDLSTGRIGCSKYKETRVKEVAEDSVSIG